MVVTVTCGLHVSCKLLCTVAECEGVLWAGSDAGAEEKPGAARIHQVAGEQAAPFRDRLHTCQTGIIPPTGSCYIIRFHIIFHEAFVFSVVHCFVLCFPLRAALTLWYVVLFHALPVIPEFPTCHRITFLDTSPHSPFSQLLPAWRQGGWERAIAVVHHWEHWETPSKKCRI